MPEKMVGLNRNVHVTDTFGGWRRLPLGQPDFPMRMHVLHPPSEQQGCSRCLLEHGELGRSQRWAVGVANWWEGEGEDKGWRRCWEHPLGQVEEGKSLLPGTTLLWLHGEKSIRNPAQRLAGSVPGLRHGSALERHLRPQHLPLKNMP